VAFIAIALGEAVRVVVVGAAVGGFAGLLGLAGLTDFLFSHAGKRQGGAGE
jgi:hypothetical protein